MSSPAMAPIREIILPDYDDLSAGVETTPAKVACDLLRRLKVKPHFRAGATDDGHASMTVVGVSREHAGAIVPFVRAVSVRGSRGAVYMAAVRACAKLMLDSRETFYVRQGLQRPSEGIRFVKQAATAEGAA